MKHHTVFQYFTLLLILSGCCSGDGMYFPSDVKENRIKTIDTAVKILSITYLNNQLKVNHNSNDVRLLIASNEPTTCFIETTKGTDTLILSSTVGNVILVNSSNCGEYYGYEELKPQIQLHTFDTIFIKEYRKRNSNYYSSGTIGWEVNIK